VVALAADLPAKAAVVALGGYGRRILTPASDVDLMVLHRERRPERVRTAAEGLFYPFWDAGIPLGHAVRTVDECLAEARQALDAACAMLDVRFLAGDPEPVAALRDRLLTRLRRDVPAFAARLRDDARRRHASYPSCGTALEPHLKEGAGGLRDLNAIGWIQQVAGREDEIPPTLDEAEEFLIRLRSALRLHTGRKGDVLLREHQPEVASAMGFDAISGIDAADSLMRVLFDHGRRTASALDLSLADALGEARHGPPGDLAEAAAWSPAALRAFVDLLARGTEGLDALSSLDLSGTLERLVPAWSAVRCRPQRDPYHRSPVDVHLLHTAATAADILTGDHRDDAVLRASAEAVVDREALLLGAFLHDIGKRGEGSHVEIGAQVAEETVAGIPLEAETREQVVFLVREHLLLAEVATRRDLADHDLIVDVAARVATPERLASLHVLTVADAEATGPHAATGWRLGLVRELVTKVAHVLATGEMDRERAGLLEGRRAAIRELLGTEEVDAYLARLPHAYLLAVSPETAAAHHALLATHPGLTEVRTLAEPGERAGTWRVTVVAADRPGLLARIAGSLALEGLSILSAQAFTTADGIAVDLFDVTPAFHGDVDEERWRSFRHTLRRALEGRISLEYRVREKRRHYRAEAPDVPTEIRVLNDASGFATVVEVETGDRIGLLFDLARTFEELHLDVALAKVATYGPRVVDAFYVTRAGGGKIDDPEVEREIDRAVRSRLEA
jgi:[protein-PII] uridylyltransferase